MTQGELYDIYGTWHIPFWQTKAWYTLIGLLIFSLCLGLIAFSYLYIRARRVRTNYWQDALNALQELDTKVYDATYVDLFYVDLTNIMKNYLHARFQLSALGKTEREIESSIYDLMLPMQLMHSFCAVLVRSSQAKFALGQVTTEQKKMDVDVCRELVLSTRPVEINEKK